jgi:hypothetical protein
MARVIVAGFVSFLSRSLTFLVANIKFEFYSAIQKPGFETHRFEPLFPYQTGSDSQSFSLGNLNSKSTCEASSPKSHQGACLLITFTGDEIVFIGGPQLPPAGCTGRPPGDAVNTTRLDESIHLY